jgi:hypothetical protein
MIPGVAKHTNINYFVKMKVKVLQDKDCTLMLVCLNILQEVCTDLCAFWVRYFRAPSVYQAILGIPFINRDAIIFVADIDDIPAKPVFLVS